MKMSYFEMVKYTGDKIHYSYDDLAIAVSGWTHIYIWAWLQASTKQMAKNTTNIQLILWLKSNMQWMKLKYELFNSRTLRWTKMFLCFFWQYACII